jgi:hypothetical protein
VNGNSAGDSFSVRLAADTEPSMKETLMFDDTTQRSCPHCAQSINWAAIRCGHCWHSVEPLTKEAAAAVAAPYSNHGEALRLTRDRDAGAIEALLNERDRLRAEIAGAKGPVVREG